MDLPTVQKENHTVPVKLFTDLFKTGSLDGLLVMGNVQQAALDRQKKQVDSRQVQIMFVLKVLFLNDVLKGTIV